MAVVINDKHTHFNTKQKKNAPIAVFDSGVGGISVLRALVKEMPNENFWYYGDSAHAPYGTKTLEEVRTLTFDFARYAISEGAKALVVACNTATSAAVRMLREQYPKFPIVGIEPALKPAVLSKDNPNVIVMATPMTIREQKFHDLMDRYTEQAHIIPLPCPGLMDLVEKGLTEGEEVESFLLKLFSPFDVSKVDAVVLGCTHYPFVAESIAKVLGDKVSLFEGGPGTARETKRRIAEAGLLCDTNEEGKIVFENSLSDTIEKEKKLELCKKLLNS